MKIQNSYIVYCDGVPKMLHECQIGWVVTDVPNQEIESVSQEEADLLIATSPLFIQSTPHFECATH